MAKKPKKEAAGDATPGDANQPKGGADSGAEEDDVQNDDAERAAEAAAIARAATDTGETAAGETAARDHEQEVGAPATEDAADDAGPSLDDLMPGIDAALGTGGLDADARIAELETEKAEQKDQLLRALAELENTRRRAERDRRDAETYGGTRLARDLLAVHDNLKRALGSADDALRENHGAFLEGVELTQRELLSAFGRHRIARVSPEPGTKFDPHLHQAMFEAPVPGAPDGTIVEVMEDGFTIADRLLRPARVGVAKGGTVAPAPETADDGGEPEGGAKGGSGGKAEN